VSVAELIYDWNKFDPTLRKPDRHIGFDDETLRDGIQSPSVVEPSIDDKLRLVDLANDLGIDTMDIGLPGAGRRKSEYRFTTVVTVSIRGRLEKAQPGSGRGLWRGK